MAIYGIYGVKSYQFVDPKEDGTFPTDVEFAAGTSIEVKEGEAVVSISAPELTPIYCEGSPWPFLQLQGNVADSTVDAAVCSIDGQGLAEVAGLDYTAATATDPEMVAWPVIPVVVNKAIRIEGMDKEGKPSVLVINNARISVGLSDTITKTDWVSARISGALQQPLDGGTHVLEWRIGEPTV